MSSFTKGVRLHTTAEFQEVFRKARRVVTPFFGLYYIANSVGPRLGIVIAKKNLKRAVARNSFKRVVRESFRSQLASLGAWDIVILGYKTAVPAKRKELRECLDMLLQKLGKDYAKV